MENNLSIRVASRHYKVSARTLRFYEEAGILKSRRKAGSRYREYDGEQLSRPEVILLLRELVFNR
jgi:DNA-binding transcriptional MerR regulator